MIIKKLPIMLTTKFLKGEQKATTRQIEVDNKVIKEFNQLTIDLITRTEVIIADFSIVGFIGTRGFEALRNVQSKKIVNNNITQFKKRISLEHNFEFSEN